MKSFFEETIMIRSMLRKRELFLLCVIVLTIVPISLHGQQIEQQTNEHPFPHPVNAAMGISDPVGSFNIRLNALRQQTTAGAENDISGHVGYGMFEWGGIHLRSLGVKTTPFTEVIGMVELWRDESRTQGLSFLGILGIPTGRKVKAKHQGVAYLAGIAGRVNTFGILTTDAIVHYDFSAGHLIVESGSVMRFMPNVFGVLDISTTFGNVRPNISLLPALKISVFPMTFVGIGYRVPVTAARDFTNQIYLQIEIGSH